jgi:alpha-ketoglutarate-dependent taurine dioxygenase
MSTDSTVPRTSERTLPGRISRAPVSLSREARYTVSTLGPGQPLPAVIQASIAGLSLRGWVAGNAPLVRDTLRGAGGILFRGFDVGSPEAFEEAVKALSGRLLEYTYRSTPRRRVAGNIYTSTEYPADRSIPLHNEMAYSRAWPMKLWFYSVTVAASGGETPIADSRKVYARIPAAVRDAFERRRVMYVRNYGPGMDLPWQDVFQTTDRTDVEQMCRDTGIEWEWIGANDLRTRQVCQAVATHPETGERVWFNQAHLFHVSSHDPEVRDLLLAQFGEAGLPRHACYGDGGAIEPEALAAVRDALDAETVRFPWQRGDVMLLDNMLAAHGRGPYVGDRKVLVGMAEASGDAACVEM